MMDFNSMNMTYEQIDDRHCRFRIGNDIVEVSTNFQSIPFFDDLDYSVVTHYIKTPGNIPTNPNRTSALMSKMYDSFKILYLKEIEEDFSEIAAFPKSINGKLQKDYRGHRFRFYKGATSHDIFKSILTAYTSTCASGDIYPLLLKYKQKSDGFLFTEIKEYLGI